MDTMLYVNLLAQSYILIKDNTLNSYSPVMWQPFCVQDALLKNKKLYKKVLIAFVLSFWNIHVILFTPILMCVVDLRLGFKLMNLYVGSLGFPEPEDCFIIYGFITSLTLNISCLALLSWMWVLFTTTTVSVPFGRLLLRLVPRDVPRLRIWFEATSFLCCSH